MKALLGIALGAAVIYLTLKASREQARSVPTLQPAPDAELRRSGPKVTSQRVTWA